jgi:hypothetical protein
MEVCGQLHAPTAESEPCRCSLHPSNITKCRLLFCIFPHPAFIRQAVILNVGFYSVTKSCSQQFSVKWCSNRGLILCICNARNFLLYFKQLSSRLNKNGTASDICVPLYRRHVDKYWLTIFLSLWLDSPLDLRRFFDLFNLIRSR